MGAVHSTALAGLVIVGFGRVYVYLRHVTGLSHLPSPPFPSYIWGHTVDLRKAVVGTRYNTWRKTLGNTYVLYEPLMEPVLVLGDPKGVSHVLNTNVTNYHRPEIDKYILRMWFGRSLLNVEDEEHLKMRKQLNPAFTPQSVKEVSHVFFELAHRLAVQWDDEIGADSDSAVFSITHSIHTFSLNAISMTMFAHDPNASAGTIPTLLRNITNGPSVNNTFTRLMGVLIGKFPQLLSLPNPMKTWAGQLRTELGKIANEVWEESREDASMEAKVIRVLNKYGKDGEVVSKDEAVAQIIGLLFAGSETVANVMGELFYELARQPTIQDKLRSELVEYERTHGHPPDIDDLTRTGDGGLPYLEAVTRETMRCKAVLMDISRCTIDDDVIPLSIPIAGSNITELPIKAGTNVSIPIRDGVNVDPTIWGPDAHVFRPERWLEGGGLLESVRSVHAFGNILTFGDGPKICLGRNFALAEFKVVASTLIPKFEFKSDGSEIDFYHLGGNTVKPKSPEFADRVRAVFRQVWDDFYAWEERYSQETLDGLMKPVKPVDSEIYLKPNDAALSLDALDDTMLDESIMDDNDNDGSRSNDADFLAVTSFSTNPERPPKTHHLQFTDVAIDAGLIPEPYSEHESCAPITRSLFTGDDANDIPFVPFADDPSFDHLQHLAHHKRLKWQNPVRNTDVELIMLETAGRLTKERWRDMPVTFHHIEQTRIFDSMLFIGEGGCDSGLLHASLQRDYVPWPGARGLNFLHSRDPLRPAADDLFGRLQRVQEIFCPNLSCTDAFCMTHIDSIPMREPKAPRRTPYDLVHAIETPCGETCCALPQNRPTGSVNWPDDARAELRTMLAVDPDWSPCDLAKIMLRPCREIFALRMDSLPFINPPPPIPKVRKARGKPKFRDEDSDKYTPCDPCTHTGPCMGDYCPCYVNKGHCERNCHCELNCIRRHRGCKCTVIKHEKLCRTKKCPCYRAGRECDPELCLPCEANTYIYLVAKTLADEDANLCQNCLIQRGQHKNPVVRIGQFGLGLFLTEPAETGDLLMEYVGEIILPLTMASRDDLARHRERNYVFALNRTYAIDAGQAGNPSRYINHAPKDEANCKALVHLVNGEHRIGIFATKDIEAGHEIFLFYGTEFFENL
ncbi:hypothetical protein EVG20_g10413 [Dentipellis fragilis]|uniref:SET domain-containing protein n=1 Tax=Dentipellis fragilis TaxID=205917 RepID=A0A4Y9XR14_9AGAM|nr:hypothetical protein EVG20_g10413 [Dentipellis fragilis]